MYQKDIYDMRSQVTTSKRSDPIPSILKSQNKKKGAYRDLARFPDAHVIRIVNLRRLPFPLVVRVTDVWLLPLTTTGSLLAGGVYDLKRAVDRKPSTRGNER